jgi:hypothetical protein
MRFRKRQLIVPVAVAVAAFALGGSAIAITNNNSNLSGSRFIPSKLPKNTYKAGTLHVHTHTNYAHPGDKARGGFAKTVTLLFDHDGRINASGIPTCAGNFASSTTLKQAWHSCGPGAGAKRNAYLSPAGGVSGRASTAPASNFPGCVLAFNGKRTAHGLPTIVLFTRVTVVPNGHANCNKPGSNTSGSTSVTLRGTIGNTGVPGYAKKLTVPNISSAPLPLDDFTTSVRRGRYVTARCHDGDHRFRIRGTFAYSGSGQAPDTVTATQKCTVG